MIEREGATPLARDLMTHSSAQISIEPTPAFPPAAGELSAAEPRGLEETAAAQSAVVAPLALQRRLEIVLFLACFFAFAYFNQGGGWNQNARFAEVRAVVEEGRFAIDDFLVYQRNGQGDDLIRCPVKRAEYDWKGQHFRLCWVDMEWNLFKVGAHPMLKGTKEAAMVERCASGDIGYVPEKENFHPNKPPGTSLLAVPGYFVIYHVERLLGINPDHWWTLSVNAWLASVCSVGLISALGCILFFRLAVNLAEGALWPAAAATVAFAFGTTFLPFGTLLFDHDLTAAFLVASFYFLRVKRGDRWSPFLAGLCAGIAVLTNYVAIGGVAALGLYALLRRSSPETPLAGWRDLQWKRARGFTLGGVGPFLILCAYGWVCYGSFLRPSTDFQSPLFRDDNAFLGMFAVPHSSQAWFQILNVAVLLAVSPFRGIFYFCPVLIFGLYGLYAWFTERRLVAEARVCLAIFGFFFVVNMFFNGFHAGFSAGPRYLIPGIPFLAFPLVVGFVRWRKLVSTVAVVSVCFNLLLTATDAQNPVGIGGHARVEDQRSEWGYNLIFQYAWPLFVHGRARPLLEQQLDFELEKQLEQIKDETADPAEQKRRVAELREDLRASFERGDVSPFLLGSIEGPVSVNPVGVFEGLFSYGFFPPRSPQVRWASFNVGELIWPQSRWSLLPLLLISGGAAGYALWLAGRGNGKVLRSEGRASPSPGG
jgi:hypothetical protein